MSFAALLLPASAAAQNAAVHGEVLDPSGAVVPGAVVNLTRGNQTLTATSASDGRYAFRDLVPGSYALKATATGFAPFAIPALLLTPGQSKELNLPLTIAVEKEQVTVSDEAQGVSIEPDRNSNALVIKGSDLDALSDDPDELQNELQALAGPAAGPNGGQIYIDGFEGGQIPPKSSILEVRVNQNPFSAENDRIGYGRIEIITKPGGAKLKGEFGGFGTASALNTANPLVQQQPSYFLYGINGNISGPLSKTSSFFLNGFGLDRKNQAIVDALDPSTLSGNLLLAFPTPISFFRLNPRVDFMIGKNNMISVRDYFSHSHQSGLGVGTLNLPDQAFSLSSNTNELQVADTIVVSPRLLLEPSFMWRRITSSQAPSLFTPAVTVQGAFTSGGAGSGTVQDHQDVFVLQNYATATTGNQTLRFGARARAYRDANFATSGVNGSYFFSSVDQYKAGTPTQYSATVIANPVARAIVFDGSLFAEDDWRARPNLLVGVGVRYEGQNRIRDHADFAPRIAVAWSPGRTGRSAPKAPPKTVVRAGYGWFYNRFTVPTAFNSGTPYIIQAIHDNLVNQKSYVVTNPGFFDPTAAEPASTLATLSASVPTYHTVDHHFHAALDMQAGIGVDRQLAKKITANATYLYTQGVHQYLTNNVTAPLFDESAYTYSGSLPSAYNYQFQSGGFYRQNQLIFSLSAQIKHLAVNGNYTWNEAKSDTQGVNSFPSVAQDPGLDYGRASFGIRHRVMVVESYTAPHGIVIGSLLVAQSGTPYNLTIGNDLTGNNQFNARPTYGNCSDPDVVATQYGCLDANPAGKNESIIPYDLGTGPANFIYHVRISKVIGIGPRIKTAGEGQTFNPNGGGGIGGRGIGGGGAAIRLDAAVPRRYNLTFVAGANNLFNIVNRGTPNGVLRSPLFNQTQSLAGGPFGSPTAGNRTVIFQSNFSF